MAKNQCRIMAFVLLALPPMAVYAQGTREDYRRAERFLAENVKHLLFEGQVAPNWIEKSARFWYRNDTPTGKDFILVDAAQNTRGPAFDQEKLAASLSRQAGKQHQARALPFDRITISEDGRTLQFDVERTRWSCDLSTYECKPGKEEPGRGPGQREGQAGRGRRPDASSPDGKFTAFVRDHNLYVREA